MKIIEKDILTVESGIICQSVNCQGKMNSGLAKSIREKWPIVYDRYIKYIQFHKNDFQLLGKNLVVPITNELSINNIFGQLYYGNDGARYTDYSAVNSSLAFMREWLKDYKRDVYFPYKIFSDRGGADWNIVSKMIEYYFPNAVICRLPEKS